jgi:catechol 2,3-dioxygenase-like lactoylglutathione lyase family enzyme
MRHVWTRGATVIAFAAGLLAGAAAMGVSAQGNRIPGNQGINHVGINVERLDDTIAQYSKVFGFGEGAIIRDEQGRATLAFIQVSRTTFIELGQANAERPAGLTHFGIQVEDIKAATNTLRQRGWKVEDPRPGRTITLINSMTDPSGVRMEMQQAGPESMLGKAIASWK